MATLAAWPCLLREEPRRQLVCTRGGPAPPLGPISQPQAPQDHSPQLPSWGVGRGPAPPPSCACSICREGHPRGARGGKLGLGGGGGEEGSPSALLPVTGISPLGHFQHQELVPQTQRQKSSRFQGPTGRLGVGGALGRRYGGGRALSSITEGDCDRKMQKKCEPRVRQTLKLPQGHLRLGQMEKTPCSRRKQSRKAISLQVSEFITLT